MRSKKIVSVFLAVCLVLSSVLSCGITASADTAYNIYSDPTVDAIAGETVSVPVYISDNEGLMGYDLNFTYDDSVLTPVSVTQGSILSDGFFEDDIEGTTSTNTSFRVFWSHAYESGETGVLFYLHFEVADDAMGATTVKIGYDKTATFDGNYDDVTLNCSDINITITNSAYDPNPVVTMSADDITAGETLSIEFSFANIGSMKSVKLTVPYDSADFHYEGITTSGVQAVAEDIGSAVVVCVSSFTDKTDGKKLTIRLRSEEFATSGKYRFDAEYSDLVGVERILVKGTTVNLSSTGSSDTIVIYTDNVIQSEFGEKQLIIPLYIKHNTGLMGYTLTFEYDPEVIEAVSATAGSGFEGSLFDNIDDKNREKGKISCLWFSNDDITVNDGFLTLVFSVLSDTETDGQIRISYNEKDIISEKTDGVKISVPDINYTVNKVLLSSIVIGSLPDKVEYKIGEELNTAGLKLKLIYNDGSEEIVDKGFTVSDLDSSTPGEKSITVTYLEKTAEFSVTVVKTLTGISINKLPDKTLYFIGEELDTTGLEIKLDYDDGSSETLTEGFDNSGFDSSDAGEKTITVEYQNKYTTFAVSVKEKSLIAVSVSRLPDKTEYFVGEELNTVGLQLRLDYDDGSFEVIESGYETSGFSSDTIGIKEVTINYQNKSTSFSVAVKDKELLSMSVSKLPDKTEYFIGEELDTEGLQLKLEYNDGSTEYIPDDFAVGYNLSGFDSDKAGEVTVTVSYNGKSATFTVTVKQKSLVAVSICKLPDKIEYYVGDELDTTGLELKLDYDDGSVEYVNSGFIIDGFDSSSAGMKNVMVVYLGISASFDVTVEEKPIILLGDTDGDGVITIIDATCIQRWLAGIPNKSFNIDAADADNSGKVTVLDVTCIQRWLVGFPENYAIGTPI